MALILLLILKFSSDVEDTLYCFNPSNDEGKGVLSILTPGEAKKRCKPRPSSSLVTPTPESFTTPSSSLDLETPTTPSSSAYTAPFTTPSFSATPETSTPSESSIVVGSSTTPSSAVTPDPSTTPESSETPSSSATQEPSTTPASETPITSTAQESSTTPVSSETPSSSATQEPSTTPSSQPSIISTTASTTEVPVISTTSSSTVAASSSAAPDPATINWGFDENPDGISPWVMYRDGTVTPSLDGDVKQNGLYSVKLVYLASVANYVKRPLDSTKVSAGVPIQISAWHRTSSISSTNGCSNAYIACTYGGTSGVLALQPFAAAAALNTWTQNKATCTYTAAQLAQSGGAQVLIGWNCKAGATAWVDTVNVGAVPA
ncbi:unnamed protein product [Clonostachys rhizophaga]|uniref:Uncharacterized protein n=1 Tax=Clonostachys rhizophaga TaxID=160324 RepID=A0A9N9YHK7_9HYPO|nr:unnamed protein product [Clonostachys rhizophaga]